MKINNNEINIDEIMKNMSFEHTQLKNRGYGILLSDEEELILNKYNINYKICTSTSQLIFMIEDYLNESYEELDDLDNLSKRLSEYHYYENTNK